MLATNISLSKLSLSTKTAYQYKEDPNFCNDEIINEISKKLTVKKNAKKQNNFHLENLIKEALIPFMQKDPFFASVYESILYAGSYYKGTKVGEPDEYDLNMVIKLPWKEDKLKFETPENCPGYVKIKVPEDSKLPEWKKYDKKLSKIIDSNNYLDQNKFRQLMESIIDSAYKNLPHRGDYTIRHKKSGPAFTLMLEPTFSSYIIPSPVINVDLVPSIEFSVPPPKRYKGFKDEPKNWSIIPKPLNSENGNLMWRISFYREEKDRLKGPMKTVIRLLKKLRDTQNMKSFVSYFIETLALLELRTYENDSDFMKLPLTCIFMHMLEKMYEAAKNNFIPFFYNKDMNLLHKISKVEMENLANRLENIISTIQRYISTDRYVIKKFILPTEENI